MSYRAVTLLAWLVWALCVMLLVVTALLDHYTPPLPEKGVLNIYAFFAVPILVYATVGALVASRRPKNPVGWILCAIGFVFGVQSFATAYADYALLVRPGSWLPFAAYVASISQSMIGLAALALAATLLIMLFPDGRVSDRSFWFVPWVAAGASTTLALWMATAPVSFDRYRSLGNPFHAGGMLGNAFHLLGGVGGVVLFVIFAATVVSLFVRRANVGAEQRQQIKWFAYAATGLLATVFLFPWITWEWPLWVSFLVVVAGLSGLPVAVGIAILRYRLYDIDIIINRTLVYGSLTAMLALLYFGGVTATQALLRTLTGEEQLPQLVVVASTLVIAALFTPLRRRIRSFIDRRFYRRKYDARKTLEAFSAQLRDETDLEALKDDLVGVVRETMQPAHVCLWLRPATLQLSRKSD
jgi:hypothetical protein